MFPIPNSEEARVWETVATRAGQRAFARLFMHAVENSTFVRVSDECYAFLSGLLVYLLSTATGHDVPCWLLRVIAVVYRTGAAGAPEFFHATLRELDLWRDAAFWTSALRLTLRAHRRHRLPPQCDSTDDDWARLASGVRAQIVEREVQAAADTVCELALAMRLLGQPASAAAAFVSAACVSCGVPAVHADTLLAHVDALRRALSASRLKLVRHGDGISVGVVLGGASSSSGCPRPSEDDSDDPITDPDSHRSRSRSKSKNTSSPSASGKGEEQGKQRSSSTSTSHQQQPPEEPIGRVVKRTEAEAAVVALVLVRAAGVLGAGLASGLVVFWDAATLARRGAVTPHPGAVALLAAGAASTLVLSAGARDASLAVLCAARRTLVRTLRGHTAPVTHAALSSRGTRAIAAARDGSLRIWDTSSGSELFFCRPAVDDDDPVGESVSSAPVITAMSLFESSSTSSPTGQGGASLTTILLAVGTEDGVVAVWDLDRRTRVMSVRAHAGAVAGVVLVDARRVLSCADDGTALLLDARRGAPLCSFLPCSAGVRAIAAAGAPRAHTLRVATAMPDGRLVWQDVREDPASGFITAGDARALCAHAGPVASLVASASASSEENSPLLMTVGSEDRTVRLWHARAREGVACAAVLRGHRDAVVAAVILPGMRIATACRDGALALWDVAAAPQTQAQNPQSPHTHGTAGGFWRKRRHSAFFLDHHDSAS